MKQILILITVLSLGLYSYCPVSKPESQPASLHYISAGDYHLFYQEATHTFYLVQSTGKIPLAEPLFLSQYSHDKGLLVVRDDHRHVYKL